MEYLASRKVSMCVQIDNNAGTEKFVLFYIRVGEIVWNVMLLKDV